MINFDDYTIKNKTQHNQTCPYTPNHPYRTRTTSQKKVVFLVKSFRICLGYENFSKVTKLLSHDHIYNTI